MKKLLYILLFFNALQVMGAEPSTNPAMRWLWEGPTQKYSNYFEFNPSATFALPDYHYGMLGLEYGRSAADKTMHLVQDGDGTSALRLKTSSYQKSGKKAFFGEASFTSDQRTNVQWCDVEDRVLLNPYLIGDSIGGDYYREAYSMGGGMSFQTGRWELGLRGLYKGGVSYRKVDPRPRNTVSSIRINPGVTYRDGAWSFGWYGQYERYRQNVDIQVEKEGRKVYFYLLQGFGIYNRQFSELEESYTRIYKGNLLSSGLHVNYSNFNNVKSGMRLAGQRDQLLASESDRRTPYSITRNGLSAELTHEQHIHGKKLMIQSRYDLLQTIGNETQYTPSTINTSYIVWNFATQSDRYENVTEEMGLSLALVDQDYRKTSIWGQLEFKRRQENQLYFTPDYQQSIHEKTAAATLGLHAPMQGSCLDVELLGGYRKVVFSDLYQAENTVLTDRLILPDFAFQSSDYAIYQAKVKYSYGLITGTLTGGLRFNGQQLAYDAQASLTLNF